VSRYTIAVLPGDGIGPEVTTEALRVLHAAAELHGFTLDTT
jgi:isocitrate/isopropylmalate dehydrogenase